MVEMRSDTTKSTHCRDVGALLLKPSHRQGMRRSYEAYSNRTWPFCQSPVRKFLTRFCENLIINY